MSQVSTVYDAFITRIGTLLSSYTRLPNPYKPEENNSVFIEKGYGVRIGPAQNEARDVGCKLGIRRQFTIVLTRRVSVLEPDDTGKATEEKLLLEDEYTLIHDFEKDSTLNGTANNTFFESDGGIEYVRSTKDNYIMVLLNVSVLYFEDLLP